MPELIYTSVAGSARDLKPLPCTHKEDSGHG